MRAGLQARRRLKTHGSCLTMSTPPLIRACPPKAIALAMLEAAQLPIEDLRESSFEHFFYAGSDGAPTGLVGLEISGADALLRSLVVDPQMRGVGLGQALVAQVEAHAKTQGINVMYLLTNTAEPFFERLGYVRADRSLAPLLIQQTREYSSLCPASAAFMLKKL